MTDSKDEEEIEIIVEEMMISNKDEVSSVLPTVEKLVKVSPKVQNKKIKPKSIKSQKFVKDGKTVYKKPCPHCNILQQNLKQHLLIHSGERKYKCQECDKAFTQISNLNTHMKVHDPNDARYRLKCQQCETTFTDPRSLKRHEAKHTGERKYECNICSKRFLYSHNLLNHVRSHLKDKRYKCKEEGCQKEYVTGGELKRHENWHKSDRVKNKKKIK